MNKYKRLILRFFLSHLLIILFATNLYSNEIEWVGSEVLEEIQSTTRVFRNPSATGVKGIFLPDADTYTSGDMSYYCMQSFYQLISNPKELKRVYDIEEELRTQYLVFTDQDWSFTKTKKPTFKNPIILI